MKYCLKFNNDSRYLNKCDEVLIKYKQGDWAKFIAQMGERRVNMLFTPEELTNEVINKISDKLNKQAKLNLTIALTRLDEDRARLLGAMDLKFYITAPCTTWEQLDLLLFFGVSDVNISGPLGFELTKVRQKLNRCTKKVQIRATPNKSESTAPEADALRSFFIRPEDIDVYEQYIDVLDFAGDIQLQDTFFLLYSESKVFIGSMGQCIYDLNLSFDNKGIAEGFGAKRRECGLKCLKSKKCRHCELYAKIANCMGGRILDKMKETLSTETSSEN